MKRLLTFTPLAALILALSCGVASASDYYVTDDGGYVYDTSSDWYTTAPSDNYGYYDSSYVYTTPDPYYNNWYGPSFGIGVNIGGDRDRDYWRHSNFERNEFRGDRSNNWSRSNTGFRSGNSSSGAVRSSGGSAVRSSGGGSHSSGGGHRR